MKNNLRTWATPLAIGAFLISAVTGVLIFFHIEGGLIEPVHKWLSWLLVAGIVLHTVANWKGFTGHFSRKAGLVIVGIAGLVTLLSVSPFFGGEDEGHNRKAVAKAAVGLLEDAPLATVASLMNTTPALLQDRLASQGLRVDDPAMTLSQIAEQNGRKGDEAVALLLAGNSGKGEREHDDD